MMSIEDYFEKMGLETSKSSRVNKSLEDEYNNFATSYLDKLFAKRAAYDEEHGDDERGEEYDIDDKGIHWWLASPGDWVEGKTAFPISAFKNYAEFSKMLRSKHIRYDKNEGIFDNDDVELFWMVTIDGIAPEYGLSHVEDTFNKLTKTTWYEEMEASFSSPKCDLKKAFDAVKKVDSGKVKMNIK